MAVTLPFGLTIGRQPAPTVPPMPAFPTGRRREIDEVGVTGTVYYSGFLNQEEYNPDLQGQKAVQVYDKMMRSDGMVGAMILSISLPIQGAIPKLEPASDLPQDVDIARAVEYGVTNMAGQIWDDAIRQIVRGECGYGHAVFEKVFVQPDGTPNMAEFEGKEYLMPYKLAPRLQKSIYRWIIAKNGDLLGVQQRAFQSNLPADTPIQEGTASGSAYGLTGLTRFIDISAKRLLVFTLDQEGSNYAGQSLLRRAYKHWWYKDNLLRIQALSAERHGVGVPYAVVRQSIRPDEENALIAALRSLHAHEKGYLLVPELSLADGGKLGMPPVGILDMRSNSLRNSDAAIQYHDRQMTLSILADFLSLGSGIGGNANVMHRDKSSLFFNALRGIVAPIEATIQRDLIRPIVDLNWPGVREYPQFHLTSLETKDFERLGRSIAQMVTSGAITMDGETENQLRELMDLPLLPEDAEGNPVRNPLPIKVSVPPAGAAPAPGGPGAPETGPEAQPLSEHSYVDPPGAAQAKRIQDQLAQQIADNAERLADENDDYDEEDFVGNSHNAMKSAALAAFLLGARSIAGKMPAGSGPKAAAWSGDMADGQRKYLEQFAADIAGGDAGNVEGRAGLYAGQTWAGFSRGRASAAPDSARIVWHAEGDATTCDLCASRDEQEYDEDDLPGFPGEGDFGDLCVSGDTQVVFPAVEVAFRRWYQGPIVKITTAGGRSLTCTPNHPVLTVQGWIDAKFLKKGDHVISGSLSDGFTGVEPDVKNRPAMIKDVFATLAITETREGMPLFSENFDIKQVRKGQVEVVGTKLKLGDRRETVSCEHCGKFKLPTSDSIKAILSRLSNGQSANASEAGIGLPQSLLLSDGRLSTSPLGRIANMGLTGGLTQSTALLERSAAINQSRTIPSVAQDAELLQPRFNPITSDSIGFCQDVDGVALQITLDEIVELQFGHFEGHVFNLRTTHGWYSANGIVTHNCEGAANCRCWLEYIGPDDSEEMSEPEQGETHKALAEARCPKCNRLMGRDVIGAHFDCPRCKTGFDVREGAIT